MLPQKKKGRNTAYHNLRLEGVTLPSVAKSTTPNGTPFTPSSFQHVLFLSFEVVGTSPKTTYSSTKLKRGRSTLVVLPAKLESLEVRKRSWPGINEEDVD
jgi:hypothetical protein